jgi:uncharacterized membrane protein
MGHIHAEVHWDVPVDRVFEVAADLSLVPVIMPSVKDLTRISGAASEAGAIYSFKTTFLGRPRAGRVEVLAADRPSLFSTLTSYDDGTTMTWTQHFAAAGTGTDEVDDVEYRVPSGIASVLLGPLIRHRIEAEGRKSVRRFAELLTSESAPGR